MKKKRTLTAKCERLMKALLRPASGMCEYECLAPTTGSLMSSVRFSLHTVQFSLHLISPPLVEIVISTLRPRIHDGKWMSLLETGPGRSSQTIKPVLPRERGAPTTAVLCCCLRCTRVRHWFGGVVSRVYRACVTRFTIQAEALQSKSRESYAQTFINVFSFLLINFFALFYLTLYSVRFL